MKVAEAGGRGTEVAEAGGRGTEEDWSVPLQKPLTRGRENWLIA